MKVIFGYWDHRGLAEPVRYLLHYLEEDFENRVYQFGPAPNFPDCPEWIKDREKFNFDCPNLPYLVDGNIKVTQRTAIMRYLARKHYMYLPTTSTPDTILLDMLEHISTDIFEKIRWMALRPDCDEMIKTMVPVFQALFACVSNVLAKKSWLLGHQISHVDFLMFDAIDIVRAMSPDCISPFANLRAFYRRFADLPGVREYRMTSKKWPILAPNMHWGSVGDPPEGYC